MRWRRVTVGAVCVCAAGGVAATAIRDSGATLGLGPLGLIDGDGYGPTTDVRACTPVDRGSVTKVLVNSFILKDGGGVPPDLTFTGVVFETNDRVASVDPVLVKGPETPPGFVTIFEPDGTLPDYLSETVGLPAGFDGSFFGGVGLVIDVNADVSVDAATPHVTIEGVKYETGGREYLLPTPLTVWFSIWPLGHEKFCDQYHQYYGDEDVPDPFGTASGTLFER